MISDGEEIPKDAIPLDPDVSTRTTTWSPDTYYQNVDFDCVDCGKPDCWTAESQQYYFEIMRASPYKQAKRCHDCRQKEVERRNAARLASGHKNEEQAP